MVGTWGLKCTEQKAAEPSAPERRTSAGKPLRPRPHAACPGRWNQGKLTQWKTPQMLWPEVSSHKPPCTHSPSPLATMYTSGFATESTYSVTALSAHHDTWRVTIRVPSLACAACVLAPAAEVSEGGLKVSGSLWKWSSLRTVPQVSAP